MTSVTKIFRQKVDKTNLYDSDNYSKIDFVKDTFHIKKQSGWISATAIIQS